MLRNQNDNFVDKNDIYTFVFQSTLGTKTNPLNSSEVSYSVNWNVLPDQKYKIHMCYMGEVNNLDGSKIASVYANFGTPTNVYMPLSTATRTVSPNSQFVGFLEMYLLGANSFLHAEDGTNSPIQINGRPRDETLTIRILENDASQSLFTPTSGNLGDYVLTLKFIPVGSNE